MLEKGAILAGYRIDGVIGQGGMGVVYKATQLSLERTVALKVLADRLSGDASFAERFRREGLLQAAIDHPHIVTVFEAGESEHGLFLAMRLVHGPNLKDLILARELDAARALRLLSQVAGALEAAHEAGLVHRDIKPQNILVGARDHAYLADFGLTKALGATGLTRTGQFVGTLDYISPEQIRGQAPSAHSDIYALAAVLYECLTGVVPYAKESDAAVLYAHLSDPPPLVTEQRRELPKELDDVICRAMAKDPEERHASAVELMQEANRAFSGVRDELAPPAPIESPEQAGIRRPPAVPPTVAAPTDVDESAAPKAPAPPTAVPAPAAAGPTEVVPAASETVLAPEAPAEAAAETPSTDMALEPEAPVEVPPPLGEPLPPSESGAALEIPSGAETRPAAPPTTVAARTAALHPPAATVPAPVPRAPEAPTAPSREGPSRRLVLIALGATVALAGLGVGGFAAGRSGEESAPEIQPTRVAARGGIELTFSGDWQKVGAQKIPGIEIAEPLGLAPRGTNGSSGLVAGHVEAAGATLLPEGFLDKPPTRDDRVRLGNLEAYRYAGLTPEGFDKMLTLYVVPTTKGVATVACFATEQVAASRLPECERIAATLALTEGEAYPLGPNEEYAKRLNEAIRKLNSARTDGRKKLGNAETAAGQAKAAESLAGAYESAAHKLEKLELSPELTPASNAVVDALVRTKLAYRDLAKAARNSNEAGYEAANRQVGEGEDALRAAFGDLEELGYR